jgi:hypothetical protein
MTAFTAFSHPDFNRNQAKAGDRTPCCICGKGIKNMSKAKHLRVNTANQFVADDVELAPGEDMGCFPIGPECLKKHPELKEWAV